jgi:hypothetical protein
MKFNKLEFVKYTEPKIRISGAKRIRALFKCDCGIIRDYDFSIVKNELTKQCNDCAIISRKLNRTTHGLIKHPLYRKWQDMKKRCYNKNVERYKSYGALGITVCDEWKNDFKAFYDWSMDNGWDGILQLDRKDVYGNYCPENCQYISVIEQGFNKRNTFYVTINGTKYCLAKFCFVNNSTQYHLMWQRLKKGVSIGSMIERYKLDLSLYK